MPVQSTGEIKSGSFTFTSVINGEVLADARPDAVAPEREKEAMEIIKSLHMIIAEDVKEWNDSTYKELVGSKRTYARLALTTIERELRPRP